MYFPYVYTLQFWKSIRTKNRYEGETEVESKTYVVLDTKSL